MDSFEKAERKRDARTRLRARRERAGQLRSRVVAISLVCFALLWGVVFVQMATGNDPALSRTAASAAAGAQESAGSEDERRRRSQRSTNTGSSAGSPPPTSSEATITEEIEAEPVEEVETPPEPEPVLTSQS